MPTRPLKEGSVTTYQAKVAAGFPDILASEMDADLDTIYAAWNGGVGTANLSNGSVTYAKLAPDAQLWSDTGAKLVLGANFTTRPVLVSGTNNPLEWGALTIKGRLSASPSQGYYYLSCNALLNTAASAWTQDSAVLPSWLMTLNSQTDSYLVSRMAAGATQPVTLLQLDASANLSVTGNINAAALSGTGNLLFNTANGATGGKGSLASYAATGMMLAVNDRWAPTAPTSPSWNLEMDTSGTGTVWLRHRAANAATGSTDQSFTFDPGGNLLISGPNATKSAGTVWINPSDRRLKDAIEDYPTGLAAILQLQPRTFLYNGKGGSTAGVRGYGFIADEVRPVMPETVGVCAVPLEPEDAEETEIETLDQSNLVLALVNAVKELAARVDAR